MSFATSEFSDTFVKSMNQDKTLFNSQYILGSLASTSPSFVFDLARDNDYNIIGIVWMISYMHDNFERFGDYILINVMHSSLCNAKSFGYIAPVIKTKLEK